MKFVWCTITYIVDKIWPKQKIKTNTKSWNCIFFLFRVREQWLLIWNLILCRKISLCFVLIAIPLVYTLVRGRSPRRAFIFGYRRFVARKYLIQSNFVFYVRSIYTVPQSIIKLIPNLWSWNRAKFNREKKIFHIVRNKKFKRNWCCYNIIKWLRYCNLSSENVFMKVTDLQS